MIGPWKRAVEAETRLGILEGQLVEAHDVIRHLSQMIGDLKRDGFNPPPPVGEAPDIQGLPHEVMLAIETRGPTRQARERLMQQARRMLMDGDADAVAERIMQGEEWRWGA